MPQHCCCDRPCPRLALGVWLLQGCQLGLAGHCVFKAMVVGFHPAYHSEEQQEDEATDDDPGTIAHACSLVIKAIRPAIS